jgi:SAM-dependent methyltransferase
MASEPAAPDDSPVRGASPVEPRVTDRYVALPTASSDVVDVLLDDVRVFSISPDAGTTKGKGRRRRVEWPAALHPYLRGSTTVTLRAHVSGEVLARQDVAFSDDPGRVRVVDEDGAALALNKWGALHRTFDSDSSGKARLLEATAELLDQLNDVIGVPSFIAYGTLLGAVRGGRLIGHDDDIDVAYYSRFDHPADIMRESLVIERRLHELGWETFRRTGAFFRAIKRPEGEASLTVDVFASYHCNGWFALHKWVRGRLDRDAILPLGEVELEGRRLPAPRDPEALLALTYGPDWRVPDPAFSFDYAPSMRLRAEGWFGTWRRQKDRWRRATRGHPATEPSPFARYVDERLADGTTVVDVGCGTGGDALWLARDGRRVIGVDFVEGALNRARRRAQETGVASARFEELNLYELRKVIVKGARIALAEPDVALYARSVPEALWPEGRTNLWLLGKVLLGGGGLLHTEFPTLLRADGSTQKVPGPIGRGLDPDEVVAEVAARGGRVVDREVLDVDGQRVCRLAVAFAR